MGLNTAIEWTQATWNPVTGCTKISEGCRNCYAERMAFRLKAMGQPNYVNGFEVAIHERALCLPFKWKRPQMVFVNSMGDLFHELVTEKFILEVFDVMRQTPQHTFQILTKRAERLQTLAPRIAWPRNVWMGVTVENTHYTFRVDHLRRTGAFRKFLSCEPLIGPMVDLDLTEIDWVIVGGESGPKARPMNPQWVRGIRDQCRAHGVPFFFKQWGGVNKKKAGRILDGRTWDETPDTGSRDRLSRRQEASRLELESRP